MIRNRYNYLTPSVSRKTRQSNCTTPKTPQAENQKDSFLPKNGQTAIQKSFTKTYMQRHTMTDIHVVNHRRSFALERSGGGRGGGGWEAGGGLNCFYVAIAIPLSYAVVYTKHFSLRERFLTHQCNISENIQIKLIQR